MGNAETLDHIDAIVAPLMGMKPWSVHQSVGSFITFEFGKEVEGYTRPRGEWHLWVEMCAWRLQTANRVIVACESPHDIMVEAIKCLEGKALERITLSAPALDTEIQFETGLLLRLFPRHTNESTHWVLFTPDRMVLEIGPGASWSYRAKVGIG